MVSDGSGDVIDTVFNQTFFNQSYFYIDIEYENQPYITSLDTVVLNEKFSLKLRFETHRSISVGLLVVVLQ